MIYAYNVAVYWARAQKNMTEKELAEFKGILDEAGKISETTVKADAINPRSSGRPPRSEQSDYVLRCQQCSALDNG